MSISVSIRTRVRKNSTASASARCSNGWQRPRTRSISSCCRAISPTMATVTAFPRSLRCWPIFPAPCSRWWAITTTAKNCSAHFPTRPAKASSCSMWSSRTGCGSSASIRSSRAATAAPSAKNGATGYARRWRAAAASPASSSCTTRRSSPGSTGWTLRRTSHGLPTSPQPWTGTRIRSRQFIAGICIAAWQRGSGASRSASRLRSRRWWRSTCARSTSMRRTIAR